MCFISWDINKVKKKKKNNGGGTHSFVKIMWGCSLSVLLSIQYQMSSHKTDKNFQRKALQLYGLFFLNDLTLKYFSPHRLYRVISVL